MGHADDQHQERRHVSLTFLTSLRISLTFNYRIKKLGPFAVQAALVGFNEDYAEYGGVLNSLTPIVEKVRVFCQQDLDINDLQAPVALPAGLKKAVDTTARAVNKIDNDLENIASKICSQFEA